MTTVNFLGSTSGTYDLTAEAKIFSMKTATAAAVDFKSGASSALSIHSGTLAVTMGGALAITGALSGVTTIGLSGAITGATATNTINGLIINSGALSGITTITASGAIEAVSLGAPGTAGTLTLSSGGSGNGNIVCYGASHATKPKVIEFNTNNTIQMTIDATGAISTAAGFTSGTSLVATTGFGCNSKTAQTAYASGGAATTTATTQNSPWGFATQAQGDGIVTLLNNIRAALVANGIMS